MSMDLSLVESLKTGFVDENNISLPSNNKLPSSEVDNLFKVVLF